MTAVQQYAGPSGGALNMGAAAVGGAAALAGIRVPALIRCQDPQCPGIVLFDYNPAMISVQRQSQFSELPGMRPTRGPISYTKKVLLPIINLNKVVFEGLTTKLRCDTLLRWMGPLPAQSGLGTNLSIDPPDVTFQWGPPAVGFMYTVKLTSCQIRYTRFDASGRPVRAEVGLTMQERPSELGNLPTNPTSGGLPGRRRHVVAEGETLYSLAHTYYGHPGGWRRIAEVNHIQDPSRVRPGVTVYLPNPDELVDRSPA